MMDLDENRSPVRESPTCLRQTIALGSCDWSLEIFAGSHMREACEGADWLTNSRVTRTGKHFPIKGGHVYASP